MDNKEDDNLGSFYMNRPQDGGGHPRRALRWVFVILILAVFGGFLWQAYPRDAQQSGSDAEVPVIKADAAPIKTVPDDPGGMEIPYQDSTVFEQLAKAPPLTEAESLRPQTVEEPVAVKKEEPVKEQSAKEEVPQKKEEPKEPEVATNPASDYYVQLGSFKEKARAEEGWKNLLKKYPDLLKDLSSKIAQGEVPGKGVYYRLQAGQVSQARAKEICAGLKAVGNAGCMVVK